MKNPLTAFFLAFIPGFGHFYLKKSIRGALYFLGFTFSIFLGLVLTVVGGFMDAVIVGIIIGIFIGLINLIDIVVTIYNYISAENRERGMGSAKFNAAQTPGTHEDQQPGSESDHLHHTSDERSFSTIILSLIPGLGHFHLGLMNRGLTFLIGFFGLATMIIFVTILTGQSGFAVFLGILPIIWIYNMFDTTQLLTRRRQGETLVDQTILEDFSNQDKGKKSKALAMILSIFPGAGHMYLGLQKRGFQLMAAFLLSIYILDVLRLSLFLFLIPLIWFFSFFDALQRIAKHEEGEQEDIPIISYLVNHQKWLGIGLLLMGLYYLLDSILMPSLSNMLHNAFDIDIMHWYHNYFQTAIVCLLLIGGGLKLLWGSKKKK